MSFTAYDKGRGGAKVDRIYIHHCASTGTPEAIRDYWERTQAASAHYIVGVDGRVLPVVPIQDTAWAVIGSNQRSISIECVNSTGSPEWGISGATLRSAGALAGTLARQLGLGYPAWGTVLRPHSQDDGGTGTYCPGRIRDDIPSRLTLLQAAEDAYQGPDSAEYVTAATAKILQAMLSVSLVDGIIGPQTIGALQDYLNGRGFQCPTDGEIGLPSWMAAQAATYWPALRPVYYDGDDTGSETIAALQEMLTHDLGVILDCDGLPGRDTATQMNVWLARTT